MPFEMSWLLTLSVFSIVAFVGSLLALPYLVIKMPRDYFVRPEPKRPFWLRLARNLVAAVLVAAGVAMLFLPGHGDRLIHIVYPMLPANSFQQAIIETLHTDA